MRPILVSVNLPKTNQSLRARDGRAGSVEGTRLTGWTRRVVGRAYGDFYRGRWSETR